MRIPLFHSLVTGLILSLIAMGAACAQSAPKTAPQQDIAKVAPVRTAVPTPSLTILFFMNPNGRPCQMQNEILSAIKDSLVARASTTYIKTTEPADRERFSVYGIRGLPSLIIVDSNNKEIKRFTPGIQSAETILAALKALAGRD
jgi:thioredoxin 1